MLLPCRWPERVLQEQRVADYKQSLSDVKEDVFEKKERGQRQLATLTGQRTDASQMPVQVRSRLPESEVPSPKLKVPLA
jgi:hypothetical protein